MRKCSILILLIFVSKILTAQQAKFITTGIIEFEKRVNLFEIIRKGIDFNKNPLLLQSFEQYKSANQQFRTYKSHLSFNKTVALYSSVDTIRDTQASFLGLNSILGQNDTIITNLSNAESIEHKYIFEDLYLVKDTINKIKWKITSETRDIIGFNCRRANGIMLDSIYVVAFYTEEIHVSSGPQSFRGLPGMILGVALPHEHLTWFATKFIMTPQPKLGGTNQTTELIIDRSTFKNKLKSKIQTLAPLDKIAWKFLLL